MDNFQNAQEATGRAFSHIVEALACLQKADECFGVIVSSDGIDRAVIDAALVAQAVISSAGLLLETFPA